MKCYIFDLGERNLTNPYVVEQPWPAIGKLAISPPDSDTLLCILKDSDTAGKPSTLFAVPILRLIRIAKQSVLVRWELKQSSTNPSL
jgi:hypothetical protein